MWQFTARYPNTLGSQLQTTHISRVLESGDLFIMISTGSGAISIKLPKLKNNKEASPAPNLHMSSFEMHMSGIFNENFVR